MDLKSFLKALKLQESTISMILGVLVIIVVGYLGIRFYTARNTQETLPPIETQSDDETPSTYIVQKGDSLWTISEKYYGTGYNWIDIKEANNLTDANQIVEGLELTMPVIETGRAEGDEPEPPVAVVEETRITPAPQITEEAAQTSSDENPQPDLYTVENGDSLWKIALKVYNDGDRWVEIAKANELQNPSVITKGQALKLTKTDESRPSETTSGENYTVQKGDSLWSIAQDAYGDGNQWTKIANANKLVNPSIIHHGNTLTIPQ
jgi:nucleoid-associated protein YgaU